MAIAVPISIALAAASPAQQTFDMNKAPDLCTTDAAAAVRIDREHGTTATYVLREEPYKSGEDAFAGALGPDLSMGNVIESNLFSLVFIEARTPMLATEQMRAQIARLCALRRNPNAKLALFESHSGADRERIARQQAIEKERRAAATASAAVAAEAERRKQLAAAMEASPGVEEIDAVVRRTWSGSSDLFGYSNTARLGRVRDATCQRAGEIFRCRIGVTAIVAGEPQYEQSDVEFWRDAEAKLQLAEPEIIVT